MCDEKQESDATTLVPDFTAVGFDESGSGDAKAYAQSEDLLALQLSACVVGSYDPSTHKICFKFPVYGTFCVLSPIPIPVGGQIKVCGTTCGRFRPTGLKVTIYLNGKVIWSGVVWGHC